MWSCKNCISDVEDNFEICWNCQFDKDGTLSTMKVLTSSQKDLKTVLQEAEAFEQNILTNVNASCIIEAGKSLKVIVYTIILTVVVTFIGIANELYNSMVIVSLVGISIVLFELYSAGANLIKSVSKK